MATGITALQKIQIGVETAAGATTDQPTTVFVGNGGMLKDNRQVKFPEQKIGVLGPTTRSYVPVTGGEITLTGEATFEQLAYILNAGLYHATPTTDTGSGYVRTWNMQCTASDAIATTDVDTLVIEGGDNTEVEEAHYGFVTDYTLAGKQGEAMTLSAHVQTRAPATDAGFTAVATPTVEEILFSQSYLYIDPSSDTPGTTAKSETLIDVSLAVTTGWKAIAAKDNRLDFSNIKNTGGSAKLDITFEHNANAASEKSAWRAQSERVIRLKFVGAALTTAGTYENKTLIVDLYGKWETFDALGDQDGDTTCKGTFTAGYSAAAAKKMTTILVNEAETLP